MRWRGSMTERTRRRRAEEDGVEARVGEDGAGLAAPGAVESVGADTDSADVTPESADGALSGAPSERLDGLLESLLFAAGAPLPLRRMVDVLDGPTAKEIKLALERLMAEYNRPQRGIHLL